LASGRSIDGAGGEKLTARDACHGTRLIEAQDGLLEVVVGEAGIADQQVELGIVVNGPPFSAIDVITWDDLSHDDFPRKEGTAQCESEE
jgi:hypothetical protein